MALLSDYEQFRKPNQSTGMLKDPNAGKITDSEVEKAFLNDSVIARDDMLLMSEEKLAEVVDKNALKDDWVEVARDDNEQIELGK